MKKSKVKSYLQIAQEEGQKSAENLVYCDADYLDDNFPQIVRNFQMMHTRIESLEQTLESVKDLFLQLNATLQIMKSFSGEGKNETKH